jgi:hypothetical protein
MLISFRKQVYTASDNMKIKNSDEIKKGVKIQIANNNREDLPMITTLDWQPTE